MSAVKPTSLPTTPVAILDRALYGSGINTALVNAIICKSEASLQYKARLLAGRGTVLNELFWSSSTHHFFDCTESSAAGFKCVIHVAARLSAQHAAQQNDSLTKREKLQAVAPTYTRRTTRSFTAVPTSCQVLHLPTELWHHILSFVRRSDFEVDVSSRTMIEQAEATEVHPLVFEDGSYGPLTPLQRAVVYGALERDDRLGGNTDLLAVISLLLKAPSAQSAHGQGGIAHALDHSAESDGNRMLKELGPITKLLLDRLPELHQNEDGTAYAYRDAAEAHRENTYMECQYELMEVYGDDWELVADGTLPDTMM
eukprot:gene2016-3911_t